MTLRRGNASEAGAVIADSPASSAAPTARTFKDAVDFVDRSYPSGTARMLRSALRQIAYAVSAIKARNSGCLEPDRRALDLGRIPLDLFDINRTLDGLSFRMAGFSNEKTFRNAKSALRRVGRDLELVEPRRAPQLPPDSPFAPLVAMTTDYEVASIRRFAGKMAAQGLRPEDVTADDIARYGTFLMSEMVGIKIKQVQRRIVRVWRKTAAYNPGWPQTPLRPPGGSAQVYPPFTAYPASVRAEIEDLRGWLQGADRHGPFSLERDRKPQRPATIKLHLANIRAILGAHVALGNDPRSLNSLRDLLACPKAIEAVLLLLWERGQIRQQAVSESERDPSWNGNTSQLDSVGVTLLMLTEHFPLPPDVLDRLRWLVKRVRKPALHGMTRKNRKRLDQFLDPVKLGLLLNLPDRLMTEARSLRDRQPARAAWLARAAVLFAIELKIPLRIKNLHTIRLGHNLRFLHARSEEATLSFPAHEMKNHRDVDYLVGPRLGRLLQIYIKQFLPLLAPASADYAEQQWLFPASRGRPGPLSADQVRDTIISIIADRVGVVFHPHLFRALAVELGLKRDPAGHERSRQLLGHGSMQTLLAHYAPIRTRQAAAHQDQLVDDEADRLVSLTLSVRRRRSTSGDES